MGHMIQAQAANAIDHAAKRAAFMHWFGIGRREADTLTALVMAKGEPMKAESLARQCATGCRSIEVSVCLLRQVMEPEAIDKDPRGYWLTDQGLDELKGVLMGMARSLVA